MLFVGELGVPTGVPIELALLIVGSLSIGSVPELLVGVLVLTLADLAGTTVLHVVSRTGGVRVLNRLGGGHEERTLAAMARWRRRLGGHDALVVFVLRLVPLVRIGVTIGTGLLQIRRRDFYLGAVPASIVWSGLPLSLGYLFRENIQAVEARYEAIFRALLLAVPTAIAGVLLIGWVRAARSRTDGVRRVRVALGGVAGLGGVAYLVVAARRAGWAIDGLPLGWLGLLGALAVALLAAAWTDFRADRTTSGERATPAGGARLLSAEMASTAVWVVAVAAAAAIVVALEASGAAAL